ncbi:hypothetical protein M0Q28_01260 [Patescibacteria group bacterium]|jgi:eight-cysteine-cluster-containing protein|nr:hypothetical protein [Patescibacteria group bacterium]
MKNISLAYIVLIAAAALLGGLLIGWAVGYDAGWERSKSEPVQSGTMDPSITNFQQCADAGNPIMESYPRQCRTPDGRNFVEEIPVPTKPSASGTDCLPAGCSGVVCADADEAANIVTTCEYRQEYACYKLTKCERQASGQCGWTKTAGFNACLSNPPALQ